MKGRNKKSLGFTLIELLVVIVMIAALMLVLVNLFLGQNKIYRTQTAELNVTSSARSALDDIDFFVRSADVVAASNGGYSTGAQILVLQIPSINAQSQIITATFDYVVFYLTGTDFFRQIFANAASTRPSGTKLLGRNVTGLAFTYNNMNYALVTEVTTDMTIQESATYQDRAITISSKSKLRNN
jgi:prepilin-type N-terminal cleavage/methylation domain-containing protein